MNKFKLLPLLFILGLGACASSGTKEVEEPVNQEVTTVDTYHHEEFGDVLEFTQYSVSKAYTFDDSLETTQKVSKNYFTDKGFAAYSKSVTDSKVTDGLRTKYKKIAFEATHDPKIMSHKNVPNYEQWKISVRGNLVKEVFVKEGGTNVIKYDKKPSVINLYVSRNLQTGVYKIEDVDSIDFSK